MDEQLRPRCKRCGGLTRFSAEVVRKTTEFHHYTIGGELHIEDVILKNEEVNLRCIICADGGDVEWIPIAGMQVSGS